MKTLCFVLGIVAGFFIFEVGRILGSAQAPERDPVEKTLQFRLVKLDPADEWLRSCTMRIVPLRGIYSDRKYCALVIIPSKDLGVLGNCKSTVYLSGYTSAREIKPIVLSLGSEISPKCGFLSIKLLDFGPARDFLPLSNSIADLVISSTPEGADLTVSGIRD